MKKRILNIALCFCMALGLLPTAALADTDDEPDWSSAITYDSDSRTYTVLSAEGLRWISGVSNSTITEDTYQTDPTLPSADFSGCTVRLGADIDLSGADWTPISGSSGVSDIFFGGTFDGAGHRVSNMHVNLTGGPINAGLLGGLSDGGSVRNLSVDGSVKVTGATNNVTVGGIVGDLYAFSGEVSVENCASDVEVSAVEGGETSNICVGGIAGDSYAALGKVSVENCVSAVKASVVASTARAFAGGIVGIAQENYGSFSLQNCCASGTVSADGSGYSAFAGGIAGSLYVNSGEASVENCVSDVEVSAVGGADHASAGGIAGGTDCDSNESISLQNCYAAVAPVGLIQNSITADSVGTYDPLTGALTATNDSTLHYGTVLSNAMKYWIYRKADADVPGYLTWTTDTIPTLTTAYAAVVTPHTYSDWTRSGDTYTRTDDYTGLPQTAEAAVTDGGTVTPYLTLADAIAAAQSKSGSTVTLLTDVTTDAEVDVASGTFTIDLNGRTWAGSPTGAADCALGVKGGNVTMTDSGTNGTFTGTRNPLNDACCTLYAESGSINVEGGIYQCASDQGSALAVGANVAATLTGGTFTSLKTTDRSVGDLLPVGCVYRSTESGNALISDVSVKKLTNVIVQAPVKITARPQSATVICGYTDAPTLRVTAVTVPADSGKSISYQWYQNGKAITSATGAEVTVPTDLAAGDYSYYCTVTCDGYTVNSAAATVIVTGSSSGGSSSGGGPSSGSTVPISGGTEQISVSVSGGTATIAATDAQLKEISSGTQTGAVKIDVSGTKADTVILPAKVASAVGNASGSEGLGVDLHSGTVILDKPALASVAGKGDVKISVETVDNSKLTDTQKAALGAQAETAFVVDVNVYVNNTRTSTFGDGKITVSVPYTLRPGENADSITVWFINDDGTIEPKTASYADGKVTFTTEHLSQYLIVNFPFTDVAESAWCYGSVAYAYDNGLFSGTSATTFGPNVTANRQMIWMVLARMDGKTPTNMAEAKTWAVENKISDGTNPTGTVTRQQMAAILYRYAQHKGYDTTQGGMAIREFADYDSISAYAQPALAWAVNAGLVQGKNNQVMPWGSTTRAQVATILQRFCQNAAK